eukprot:scaffold20770_cov65-Phaeocystis_antarctica.AAC.3
MARTHGRRQLSLNTCRAPGTTLGFLGTDHHHSPAASLAPVVARLILRSGRLSRLLPSALCPGRPGQIYDIWPK